MLIDTLFAWGWLLPLLAIAIAILLTSLRVANEYQRGVVLRLGRLVGAKGPGLYLLWPIIDRQTLIDLRVITAKVEQQEAITKDNVPIKVDAVVWYRINDPVKSVIAVKDAHSAVTQIALTTLRNVIGRHTLDDVLKEMEKLSTEMRATVDAVTEVWGVEVQLVEMKDVVIPQSMQRAMAQEAEALREKRARIIKADAEFEAAQRLNDAATVIMKRSGIAPDANDHRSRRRAEHDDHHHDAVGVRVDGARHRRRRGVFDGQEGCRLGSMSEPLVQNGQQRHSRQGTERNDDLWRNETPNVDAEVARRCLGVRLAREAGLI